MKDPKMKALLDGVVNEHGEALPSPRDRDFLYRVYNSGLDFYLRRLSAIGFTDHKSVLDAGCGFGQWSLALASLNQHVFAIDYDSKRVRVGNAIADQLDKRNVAFTAGSIDALPYDDETFGAIFCYSTLYQTNYAATLWEFHRVLAPGGLFYISTNDWGWYLYNLTSGHNPSRDFNPRKYALATIINTIRYKVSRKYTKGKDLVTPMKALLELLQSLGFENLTAAGEGQLRKNPEVRPEPIYSPKYLGLNNVYEIIGEKKG